MQVQLRVRVQVRRVKRKCECECECSSECSSECNCECDCDCSYFYCYCYCGYDYCCCHCAEMSSCASCEPYAKAAERGEAFKPVVMDGRSNRFEDGSAESRTLKAGNSFRRIQINIGVRPSIELSARASTDAPFFKRARQCTCPPRQCHQLYWHHHLDHRECQGTSMQSAAADYPLSLCNSYQINAFSEKSLCLLKGRTCETIKQITRQCVVGSGSCHLKM